jgi:hypothetical protein
MYDGTPGSGAVYGGIEAHKVGLVLQSICMDVTSFIVFKVFPLFNCKVPVCCVKILSV